MGRGQSKRWAFTLNNWTIEEKLMLDSSTMLTYLVYGKEIAPSTGTPHLQGYMELEKAMTMQSLKGALSLERIALGIARKSAKENTAYCSKADADYFIRGVPAVSQGKRSDLDGVLQAIRDGATMKTLWEEHSVQMTRFHAGISRAYVALSPNLKKPLSAFPMESFPETWNDIAFSGSVILWGESGVGKTSYAVARMKNPLVVSHMDDLVKYNDIDYSGILFDDMDFKHIPRTAQIHLVDQDFERSIHVRYQVACIPANTLKVFTTNEYQGCIFAFPDKALERRVKIYNLIK